MFNLKQGNAVLYMLIVVMGLLIYFFLDKANIAKKEAEQAKADVQLSYEAMGIIQNLNEIRFKELERVKATKWIKGLHETTF